MKKINKIIKQNPLFIMDESSLVQIFENNHKEKATQVMDLLTKFKEENVPFFATTTLPSFLRALYVADHTKVKFENIQKVMGFLTLGLNYKNEKQVRQGIISLANNLSKNIQKNE